MIALAGWLLAALQATGVELAAEAFPPGSPAPGYAAVRVRVSAPGGAVSGTLRLATAGGSVTELPLALAAGAARDLVAAVWRADERGIDVSFGSSRARVEPGPSRQVVLCVGSLAEAERASDTFGCGLPDVMAIDRVPELVDTLALDGFAGVAAEGLPAERLAGRTLRGGAVAGAPPPEGFAPWSERGGPWPPHADPGRPLPRRSAATPVLLGAALPADRLVPGDLFGSSSGPLRLAFASAVVLAALAAALGRRPWTVVAVVVVVAAAGSSAVSALGSRTESRVRVASPGGPDLELRGGAPAGPASPLAAGPAAGAVAYPLGGRPILRRLGPGAAAWESPGPVLLASPEAPEEPTEGLRTLAPSEAPSAVLRSLCGAAALALGGGGAARWDPARGVLLLVTPPR